MDIDKTDLKGHFYIGYEDENAMFQAFSYNESTDKWHLAEVSYSLDGILQKCRERGFTTFHGLTVPAIDFIYRWLTFDYPTLQHVEGLWGGEGRPSQTGPARLGFRSESMEQRD